MYNAEQIKQEAWVKGFKAGRGTQDEWQALEQSKSAAWKAGFDAGRAAGFAAGYAAGEAAAYEKGYQRGRQQGFLAGYAAASEQPAAKIEAAYEQGVAKAALLQPVLKNGVGY